jgi:hypothetical protein
MEQGICLGVAAKFLALYGKLGAAWKDASRFGIPWVNRALTPENVWFLVACEKAWSGSKFPLAFKTDHPFTWDIAATAGAGKGEKWRKVRRSKHLRSL